MIVKLLTEHHLEFLSLKGGCTGSSESTFVKMSNCWKSHAAAHILISLCYFSGRRTVDLNRHVVFSHASISNGTPFQKWWPFFWRKTRKSVFLFITSWILILNHHSFCLI